MSRRIEFRDDSQGDQCTFSHSAADANRAPELCKWYADTYCRKGAHCQYLHAEWPCLDFHRGRCHRAPCKFSHQALDAYTRPIIDTLLASGVAVDAVSASGGLEPECGPLGAPRPQRRPLLTTPVAQRGHMDGVEFAAALQGGHLQFVHEVQQMLMVGRG